MFFDVLKYTLATDEVGKRFGQHAFIFGGFMYATAATDEVGKRSGQYTSLF
jgi:hypothetical protein